MCTGAVRVAVIDEDLGVRRLLRRELTAAGFHVQDFTPGPDALRCIADQQFDLLILDIDSPTNGADAIRTVREHSPVPIVAVSAYSNEDAAVGALDTGADDCVRKPFGVKELLARIRNALRRRAREQDKLAHVVTGDLEINLLDRRVSMHGRDVHLPYRCYQVLRVLTESAGKVLTHTEIMDAVWGSRRTHRVDYLRIAIKELRRKLEADPSHPEYILTEHRVGYRLAVSTLPAPSPRPHEASPPASSRS